MKIVIVDASGAVGQEFLRILEQRKLPLGESVLLSSQHDAGTTCSFRGKDHEVKPLQHNDDFKDIDVAFVLAGGGTSRKFTDTITKHGIVMIDSSSVFHMDEDVPLVMSEVNAEGALKRPRNIIVNPNCTTIAMVVVLKPIGGLNRIKRVRIPSYQSASGAGAVAMAELQQQYKELVETGSVKTVSKLPHQLVYNAISQVDVFMDNGYTKEEMKMFNETRKIMHSDVKTGATCVRVSSLRSRSESAWLETEHPLSVGEVRQVIAAAPGCMVKGDPIQASYPVPLKSVGYGDIYVGRIRKGLADDNGMTLWLTGNQVRKGAVPNAVQIAGYLIKVGNTK